MTRELITFSFLSLTSLRKILYEESLILTSILLISSFSFFSSAAETVAFSSSSLQATTSGGNFWATELAWQREELAKTFTVTLSEPQTVAQTFNSYTTYLVTSTLSAEGVRRRYSDFDWLRDLLVARYHGIAVPIMPEKKMIGNQSKGFIEERMQGLEQFMLLVLTSPYLRGDATLRMFLTQKGTAEFEQQKKAANGGVGADPASNAGLARWFRCLREIQLPEDADKAIVELMSASDDMEARVVTTLAAVTKLWEATTQIAGSLRAVRDALGDWSSSVTNASTAMTPTLGPLKTHSAQLGGKLKKSADAFSNAFDLAVFAPNEVQIFLLDGLVTEVHRIRSLMGLLAVREQAQKNYNAAWLKQEKLKFEAKQFRDKLREDKAVLLEPKIAEAEGAMKRLKDRLDDITKGTLYIESDKISRARTVRVIAMVGQYAALSIASGVRSQELWASFLGSMELDQNTMVSDAQATLTGQTSMHGLDAVPGATISLPVSSSTLAGITIAAPTSSSGAATTPARAAVAPPPVPSASGALFSGAAEEPLFGGEASVDL
jgi:hypothetical protein